MSTTAAVLHAFKGYGIELEYMIVDKDRLSVLPVADKLLLTASGNGSYDVNHGLLDWSNELVLHVIEVKNSHPVAALDILPAAFQKEIDSINEMLAELNARLMPTAMHPWMDPLSETTLWPHENQEIYQAYHRIFNSRGHGWSNLQSMHINLPFANDREFALLHAAIRLVIPLIPALAASSPFAEGRSTGFADYRMEVYCHNSDQVPAIAGQIVPETVASHSEYQARILEPMYRDIAHLDPEHILQHEWLNSRGAIARFDRNAIEIRVVDTQEYVGADLAVAAAICHVVEKLYTDGDLAGYQTMATEALAAILQDTIRNADETMIDNAEYLHLLGYSGSRCNALALWRHLLGPMLADTNRSALWKRPLETILQAGPLARRILRALDNDESSVRLHEVYRELCDCLQQGRPFLPATGKPS